MKLIKMVLCSAFVPMMALAEPPPAPETGGQATPETGAQTPEPQQDTAKPDTKAMDIGLTAKALTPERRASYGGPTDAGLLVTKVESGGAADKAGVKVGDVITKIDSTLMTSTDDLNTAWKAAQTGGKPDAAIEVFRNHQTKTLKLSLDQSAGNPPKTEAQPKTEDQPKPQAPKGGY
jgi:C-terminal processing protease CtpA/Prc